MRIRLLRAAAVLSLVVCAADLAPAAETPKSIRIVRVEAAPKLEDYVSGTGPGAAADGFLQREPGDLTPASEATRAFLSYDAQNLYVAFVCKAADPSSI